MPPRIHRLLYPTPSPLAEVSTSVLMAPIASLYKTSLSCSLLTWTEVTAYQLLLVTISSKCCPSRTFFLLMNILPLQSDRSSPSVARPISIPATFWEDALGVAAKGSRGRGTRGGGSRRRPRTPAGPETIVNGRLCGAGRSGCSSTRPSGDAARRRQCH